MNDTPLFDNPSLQKRSDPLPEVCRRLRSSGKRRAKPAPICRTLDREAGNQLNGQPKRYNIVYADPPWDMKYLKETKRGYNVYELPYETMKDSEIIALPVREIIEDDAILFMWVIDSRISIMPEIMKAWGFTYKTVGFVWNKLRVDKYEYSVNASIGKYTRKSCEFCFIGTRGKSLAKLHTQFQYVAEPKREHSRKPDRIRQMIVRMCGDLPRVELFAREQKDGWDVFGNEVDNSIALPV